MSILVDRLTCTAAFVLLTTVYAVAQPTGASAWIHYAPTSDGLPEHAAITGEQLQTPSVERIALGQFRVFLNRGSRADTDYTVMASSNDRNAVVRAWIESRNRVRIDVRNIISDLNVDTAAFTLAIYESGFPFQRKGALAGAYCRPLPNDLLDVTGWQLSDLSPQIQKYGPMGQYLVRLDRSTPAKGFGVLIAGAGSNIVTSRIVSDNSVMVYVLNEIGLPTDSPFSLLVYDAANSSGKLASVWGTYRWPTSGSASEGKFFGYGVDSVVRISDGLYSVFTNLSEPTLDCVILPSALDSNRYATGRIYKDSTSRVIVGVRGVSDGEFRDGSFSIAIVRTADPTVGVEEDAPSGVPMRLNLTEAGRHRDR